MSRRPIGRARALRAAGGGSVSVAGILGGGLLEHLDAGTLSNGDTASWLSVGPGGSTASQGTAARRPSRAATSCGGRPGVTAAGDDFLEMTLNTQIAAGSRPWMAFVGGLTSLQAGCFVLLTGAAETEQLQVYATLAGGSECRYSNYRWDNSNGAGAASVCGGADLDVHVFEIGMPAGGTDTSAIDGARRDHVRTGTPTNPFTKVRFFAETNVPGAAVRGVIGEWVLCTSEPTTAQKRALRAHWYAKYSIRSMMARSKMFNPSVLDGAILGRFCGAASYGGYSYAFPISGNHGRVVRGDESQHFEDATSWQSFNRTGLTPSTDSLESVTGVGRYAYATTSGNKLIRYDMAEPNFTSPAAGSWLEMNLSTIPGVSIGNMYLYPFANSAGTKLYLPHCAFGTSNGVQCLELDISDPSQFQNTASYKVSPTTTSIGALCKGFFGGAWVEPNAQFPQGAAFFLGHQYDVDRLAATTNGSDEIEVADTSELAVGALVTGAGIPGSSVILDITGTTVTLSKNATATNASVSLHFAVMHGNHILWDPSLGSFSTLAAWSTVDVASFNPEFRAGSDACFMNGSVYVCPGEIISAAGDGKYFLKWDTSLPIANAGSWASLAGPDIYPADETLLHGYTGIFADHQGRYVAASQLELRGDGMSIVIDTEHAGGFVPAAAKWTDTRHYGNGNDTHYGFYRGAPNSSGYLHTCYHGQNLLLVERAA